MIHFSFRANTDKHSVFAKNRETCCNKDNKDFTNMEMWWCYFWTEAAGKENPTFSALQWKCYSWGEKLIPKNDSLRFEAWDITNVPSFKNAIKSAMTFMNLHNQPRFNFNPLWMTSCTSPARSSHLLFFFRLVKHVFIFWLYNGTCSGGVCSGTVNKPEEPLHD